jgi:hypothetical protein
MALGKTKRFDKYDVNLSDLHKRLKVLALNKRSKKYKQVLQQIEGIYNYCELENIDTALLVQESPVIIYSNDSYYQGFFCLSLALLDPNLIGFYLDYHKANFLGNAYIKPDEFVSFIQKRAYDSVKSIAIHDSAESLRAIVRWVDKQLVSDKPDALSLKDDTKKLWFKVGVELANGNIEILYTKLKTYRKVAIELGNIQYRPYISDSYANVADSPKNIYIDKLKMQKIHTFCIEHNVGICETFLKYLNSVN